MIQKIEKKTKKMKKVRVFIEQGPKGDYSAYMPDDDGLDYGITGEGKTIQETVDDFHAVYEGMKELFAEQGRAFEEVEFDISYDIPSFLAYYKKRLTLTGLGELTGISQPQLSQYISGYRKPSKKTSRKIEEALHSFGEELQQVHFI